MTLPWAVGSVSWWRWMSGYASLVAYGGLGGYTEHLFLVPWCGPVVVEVETAEGARCEIRLGRGDTKGVRGRVVRVVQGREVSAG